LDKEAFGGFHIPPKMVFLNLKKNKLKKAVSPRSSVVSLKRERERERES